MSLCLKFRIGSAVYRFKEWAAIKLAWMLPERVAMWAAYRVGAHATQGQWGNESPANLLFMDAVGRWPVR